MKSVALIANLAKENVHQVACRICSWCRGKGIRVHSQQDLDCGDEPMLLSDPLPPVDMVMVLGGDGTFLSVARRYSEAKIPFLGINLGRLGFLTEVEVADLEQSLDKLARGQYYIDRRNMLSVSVLRRDEVVEQTFALNEVTVAKGPLARIIKLDVAVDEQSVGRYYGDGLIVSTPTGSTGYSLSAGGPIMAPNVRAMVMTPICPHTLHARPVVVGLDARCVVEVGSSQQEIVLTVDGQHSFYLHYQDKIEISTSRHQTLLVRLHGKNFYNLLRRKLLDYNQKG